MFDEHRRPVRERVPERRAPVLVLDHVHPVVRAAAHAHGERDAAPALVVRERVVAEPACARAVRVRVVEDAADDLELVADRVPALVELALAADDDLVLAYRGARALRRPGQNGAAEAVLGREVGELELRRREVGVGEARRLVRSPTANRCRRRRRRSGRGTHASFPLETFGLEDPQQLLGLEDVPGVDVHAHARRKVVDRVLQVRDDPPERARRRWRAVASGRGSRAVRRGTPERSSPAVAQFRARRLVEQVAVGRDARAVVDARGVAARDELRPRARAAASSRRGARRRTT